MTSEELTRLKQKFPNMQTGGKGSIRRKKFPNSKKQRGVDMDNEAKELLESIDTTNNLLRKVDITKKSKLDDYIHFFKEEFCDSITKQHKKSNKCDNHGIIKDKLKTLLSINNREMLDNELSQYLLNNFTPKALTQVSKLFQLYCDIIKFGDYDTFSIINIPPNDSELEKAYTLLDVDYAVNITPSFFRSQYIKEINKSTDKDKRDAITKAYNSILSLIIKKDLDEDPDENLQLVSD